MLRRKHSSGMQSREANIYVAIARRIFHGRVRNSTVHCRLLRCSRPSESVAHFARKRA